MGTVVDIDSRYPLRVAARNYGLAAVLAIGILGLSFSEGAAREVIYLRLALVPLIFLAPLGLGSLYRKPIFESRYTVRGLEFTILNAVVASAALYAVLWLPDNSHMDPRQFVVSAFLPILFVCILFMVVDVQRKKKQGA